MTESQCLTVHRQLHDGAHYTVTAAEPGVTTVGHQDADDEATVVAMTREQVRQYIADLELVAGLVPTPSAVPLADRLAGSIQRVFELLKELDKTDHKATDRLLAAITSHIRNWRPAALTEVP